MRKVRSKLKGNVVLIDEKKDANSIHQKGFYGEWYNNKLILSLIEALYLVEKEKIVVKSGRKNLTFNELLKISEKENKDTFLEYVAYRDLRERGYIVKTGFKFGSHFRVYKRGDVPGIKHSAYLVHAVPEHFTMSLTELSRMIRLANSVKKKIWIAVVDDEGDLTYYEFKRIKP